MYSQESMKVFNELFPENMKFDEIACEIDKIKDVSDALEMREILCDQLLDTATSGYLKYEDKIEILEGTILKLFCDEAMKLKDGDMYYKSVAYFFQGNYKECMESLKRAIKKLFVDKDMVLDELNLSGFFIVPFKNAFKGFWKELECVLSAIKTEEGICELCMAMECFYRSDSNDEIVDMFTTVLQKNPQSYVAKEILGYTYYCMKMWGNTIAYLEQVDKPQIFYLDNIYSFLAWAHSKMKDYQKEIEYYEKCLESFSDAPNALNNLGYAYYRTKQYSKALEILQKCVEEKRDFPYAVNNYVRTLLAIGRNNDAKKFVKSSPTRISKSILDRVKKTDNTNARIKKDVAINIISDEDTSDVPDIKVDLGVKKYQFSNEKLLEDELTLRIESGIEVFGLPLKIYRRKGEYGRQYIIPIGRLDLLAEDKDENLYIIELKKDSGYGDAYKQTIEYMEWFEKNKNMEGKKIFGIVCVNNPTVELIEAVKKNDRIKLYEYKISYSEIC